MVSKKGIDLLGTSVVNYICGLMELMCGENCWLCSASWIRNMSSTYLSQRLGGLGAVLMALDSNSSMNRSATIVMMWEPMAVPWTCS